MTSSQADRVLADHGLVLEQGDRFFSSDVPPGRVMSQAPAPGIQVRRGWHVRVAESMGPQRVVIPDLIGGSERAAEINIRRRGLELGSIATATIPDTSRPDRPGQKPNAENADQRLRAEDQPAAWQRPKIVPRSSCLTWWDVAKMMRWT